MRRDVKNGKITNILGDHVSFYVYNTERGIHLLLSK